MSNAFHSPLVEPVLDGVRTSRERTAIYRPADSAVFQHAAGDGRGKQPHGRRITGDRIFGTRCASPRPCGSFMNTAIGCLSRLGRHRFWSAWAASASRLAKASGCLPCEQDRDDWQQLLESLGQLYANGVDVRLGRVLPDAPARKITPPHLPVSARAVLGRFPPFHRGSRRRRHPRQDIRCWAPVAFRRPVFEQHLSSLPRSALLKDHRVFEQSGSSGHRLSGVGAGRGRRDCRSPTELRQKPGFYSAPGAAGPGSQNHSGDGDGNRIGLRHLPGIQPPPETTQKAAVMGPSRQREIVSTADGPRRLEHTRHSERCAKESSSRLSMTRCAREAWSSGPSSREIEGSGRGMRRRSADQAPASLCRSSIGILSSGLPGRVSAAGCGGYARRPNWSRLTCRNGWRASGSTADPAISVWSHVRFAGRRSRDRRDHGGHRRSRSRRATRLVELRGLVLRSAARGRRAPAGRIPARLALRIGVGRVAAERESWGPRPRFHPPRVLRSTAATLAAE